ncbi:MAG TPA: HNH endonuclease signature motif containing protein [Hymenobacter sp.]|jgi:hypothetical protein|uniref:HNH endonuclease signature motif containing protein n=1 Tax=Hymenobacter sp. TaxID=1898978 RepID=UPI002EDAB1C4
MSRPKIPERIQKAVKAKHFLECAWDGTRLTDQHHIEHWYLGGQHTAENLILLCPNCHRQVHQGSITDAELRARQATHQKGDRQSFSFPFGARVPAVRLGGNTFVETPILIQVGDDSILSYKVASDGEVLFSARLYDEDGNLFLWMSDNRICTPAGFRLISDDGRIDIVDKSDPNHSFSIWQEDGILNVLSRSYLAGRELLIHPALLSWGGMKIRTTTVSRCEVGFHIPLPKLPPTLPDCSITVQGLTKGGWPHEKPRLLQRFHAPEEEREITVWTTPEGQLSVQVQIRGTRWRFMSQRLNIAPASRYFLFIETFSIGGIKAALNGYILEVDNSFPPTRPVHSVSSLTAEEVHPFLWFRHWLRQYAFYHIDDWKGLAEYPL